MRGPYVQRPPGGKADAGFLDDAESGLWIFLTSSGVRTSSRSLGLVMDLIALGMGGSGFSQATPTNCFANPTAPMASSE